MRPWMCCEPLYWSAGSLSPMPPQHSIDHTSPCYNTQLYYSSLIRHSRTCIRHSRYSPATGDRWDQQQNANKCENANKRENAEMTQVKPNFCILGWHLGTNWPPPCCHLFPHQGLAGAVPRHEWCLPGPGHYRSTNIYVVWGPWKLLGFAASLLKFSCH